MTVLHSMYVKVSGHGREAVYSCVSKGYLPAKMERFASQHEKKSDHHGACYDCRSVQKMLELQKKMLELQTL